jgi:hypothetical protein
VTSTFVYAGWAYYTATDTAGSGIVAMVPVDGGTPIEIASEQHKPASVQVDDTGVYWGNDNLAGGYGEIMHAPRL